MSTRWIRFVAGVGLAGELGAGITLVSESMRKETRGFGTTIVATVGICGAIVAVLVGKTVGLARRPTSSAAAWGWRCCVLRLGVMESGMFDGAAGAERRRAATSSRCSPTGARAAPLPGGDPGRACRSGTWSAS